MSVSTALSFRIADEGILALAQKFEGAPPQTVLRWAIEEFGAEVALATGFGTEGCILIDMIASIKPATRIFYLDTDLHFPETYELCELLTKRYGVLIERRSPIRSLEQQTLRHGGKLWE